MPNGRINVLDIIFICSFLSFKSLTIMVRKLKYQEKKLLKKVDFITWDIDSNLHESKILRRYHITKREQYSLYNTLAVEIRDIAKLLKELPLNDSFRQKNVKRLLDKLYSTGLIPSVDSLERANKVSASSLCRRRLPVVMQRLGMTEFIREASEFVEQGHVRVGSELITDPAFLVSRSLVDMVTWTNKSKIREHVLNYNNERDDFYL